MIAGVTPGPGCAEQPKVDSKAAEVIRDFSNAVREAKTLRVTQESSLSMVGPGMKSEQGTTHTLAVQRPNKFASILEEGMGGTIVCDGKKVYSYLPMLGNKFMESEAPQDLEDLFTGTEMAAIGFGGAGMAGMAVVQAMVSSDPYAVVLEDVTRVEYAGTEDIGGVKCHHLKFEQPQADLEVWFTAKKPTLVARLVPDMSKILKQRGGGGLDYMKDIKMEMALIYRDWEIDAKLPEGQFKFIPPEGAEKVDSFFGGMDEKPHALLGKQAPAFELELLEGGKANLADHKDKNIVVLDFWATWCGPCREGLPTLVKVTNEYKGKGVVFYAVNQQESAERVREFLKKEKLKCVVAMDKDGKVSNSYEVKGIPQTVVIGKDGKVHAVHVGLLPNLKTKLSGELDALLAGKDLAEEAQKKEAKRMKTAAEPTGLEQVWTFSGAWNGIVGAPAGGQAHAVGPAGQCVELDAAGKKLRQFKIDDNPSVLRTANLIGDDRPELVTFTSWGRSVKAHSLSGNQLWSYALGQGVDDACAADLNGDGLDEVIIGYNGGTGVHVLDNTGTLLWKYTDIGNVWHVCAGDVNGDGNTEVVTTSAQGQVHVFDAAGKKLKDLRADCYATMVRLARVADKEALIIVGGSGEGGVKFEALAFDGSSKWSIDLPAKSTAHIDSACASSSSPWIAVGLRGGLIHVVDVAKGEIIGTVDDQGQRPEVGWLEPGGRKDVPLLLVATGREVGAYRVDRGQKKGLAASPVDARSGPIGATIKPLHIAIAGVLLLLAIAGGLLTYRVYRRRPSGV